MAMGIKPGVYRVLDKDAIDMTPRLFSQRKGYGSGQYSWSAPFSTGPHLNHAMWLLS